MADLAPARAVALAVVLVGLGCGGGLGLRIEVVEPAVIPAHVFPRVFVRGDGGLDAELLANAVVTDLRGGGIDALEISPGASARLELTSDDASALLVTITVVRSSSTEARHYTEMMPLCAPGCSTAPVERLHDVTVLHAHAELTMRDARTGDAFAEERIERSEDDLDMGAGGRLMDRLRAATLELFHASRSMRDVDLMALTSAEGRAALDDARAGRIGRAARALRTLAEHAETQPIEERVAIYYDLGQVVRALAIDGGVELEAEARAALDEAMHLRPDARTGRALEALEEESRLRARAREEDAAYRRNRGETVPPAAPVVVPSGYE